MYMCDKGKFSFQGKDDVSCIKVAHRYSHYCTISCVWMCVSASAHIFHANVSVMKACSLSSCVCECGYRLSSSFHKTNPFVHFRFLQVNLKGFLLSYFQILLSSLLTYNVTLHIAVSTPLSAYTEIEEDHSELSEQIHTCIMYMFIVIYCHIKRSLQHGYVWVITVNAGFFGDWVTLTVQECLVGGNGGDFLFLR